MWAQATVSVMKVEQPLWTSVIMPNWSSTCLLSAVKQPENQREMTIKMTNKPRGLSNGGQYDRTEEIEWLGNEFEWLASSLANQKFLTCVGINRAATSVKFVLVVFVVISEAVVSVLAKQTVVWADIAPLKHIIFDRPPLIAILLTGCLFGWEKASAMRKLSLLPGPTLPSMHRLYAKLSRDSEITQNLRLFIQLQCILVITHTLAKKLTWSWPAALCLGYKL